MQLNRYKLRPGKISRIFISHMHGDHYFGLPGLLTSMGLMSRTREMHLHGPAELKPILDLQFQASGGPLPYPLYFHPLPDGTALIADNNRISVHCFRVEHRIPCWGFLFREKKNRRKLDPSRIAPYGIPTSFYEKLQNGEDYLTPKGTRVANEDLTLPGTRASSYAYCADTLYLPALANYLQGVDLIYHETTYLKDQTAKAAERYHSTTEQAAQLALAANAGQLLIGHFSAKYEQLDDFLKETQALFPKTILATEGSCIRI